MTPNKSGTETSRKLSDITVGKSIKNIKSKCIHTCMRLIDTINSPISNKLRENIAAIDKCNRLKKHFFALKHRPNFSKFQNRDMGCKHAYSTEITFLKIKEQQAAFTFIISFIISSYVKKEICQFISPIIDREPLSLAIIIHNNLFLCNKDNNVIQSRIKSPYRINFAPNILIKALNKFGFRFIEDALANSDLHILKYSCYECALYIVQYILWCVCVYVFVCVMAVERLAVGFCWLRILEQQEGGLVRLNNFYGIFFIICNCIRWWSDLIRISHSVDSGNIEFVMKWNSECGLARYGKVGKNGVDKNDN
ncbi:hypothetical protein AGLY_005188 [Aphis glycines]|uniref:Uncharacterized protein n=1 Tax=Aphis glycines TaxID=307491 RepID=A0A6G0TXB5_APHGL|nr:hypothetical protein AGLY_005188 [Aphis glycines]